MNMSLMECTNMSSFLPCSLWSIAFTSVDYSKACSNIPCTYEVLLGQLISTSHHWTVNLWWTTSTEDRRCPVMFREFVSSSSPLPFFLWSPLIETSGPSSFAFTWTCQFEQFTLPKSALLLHCGDDPSPLLPHPPPFNWCLEISIQWTWKCHFMHQWTAGMFHHWLVLYRLAISRLNGFFFV